MNTINFFWADFESVPVGSKYVRLTPTGSPDYRISASYIVGKDRISEETDTTGYAQFPDVVTGYYNVELIGPRAITHFSIYSPTGSATYNAKDLIVAFATGSLPNVYLTVSQSDARYWMRVETVDSASYALIAATASYSLGVGSVISASWASSSISASHALVADVALNVIATPPASASWASSSLSASRAITASIADWANGADYANNSNFATTATTAYSASMLNVISGAVQPFTSSRAVTASFADSASYAIRAGSASYAPTVIVTGATYQITSSWAQNALNLTPLTAAIPIQITASQALTASFITSASHALVADTASYVAGTNVVGTVASASFATFALTSSYELVNEVSTSWSSASLSASHALVSDTASYALNVTTTPPTSASWASSSISASHTLVADSAIAISFVPINAVSASWASSSVSASYVAPPSQSIIPYSQEPVLNFDGPQNIAMLDLTGSLDLFTPTHLNYGPQKRINFLIVNSDVVDHIIVPNVSWGWATEIPSKIKANSSAMLHLYSWGSNAFGVSAEWIDNIVNAETASYLNATNLSLAGNLSSNNTRTNQKLISYAVGPTLDFDGPSDLWMPAVTGDIHFNSSSFLNAAPSKSLNLWMSNGTLNEYTITANYDWWIAGGDTMGSIYTVPLKPLGQVKLRLSSWGTLPIQMLAEFVPTQWQVSASVVYVNQPVAVNTRVAKSNVALTVAGNVDATSFTGSLNGTASWADNAISTSYAQIAVTTTTADFALLAGAAIQATTASYASTSISASYAANVLPQTPPSSASWASASVSASYATFAQNIPTNATAGYADFAANATSASWASASYTASYLTQNRVYNVTTSRAIFADTASVMTSVPVNAVSASYASSSVSASFAPRDPSGSLYLPTSSSIVAQVNNANWVPPTTEGTLYWDNFNRCYVSYADQGTSITLGQECDFRVAAGENIPFGSIVYYTGQNQASASRPTRPVVKLAIADGTNTKSTIMGIATQTIASGSRGFVMAVGRLDGLNTSTLSQGVIYLSPTISGSMTSTRPSPPNEQVVCGDCIVSDATAGVVIANIANIFNPSVVLSAGVTSVPTIAASGSGANFWANISTSSVNLYNTADGDDTLLNYYINSQSLAIPATGSSYFIYADYNGGSPNYGITTDRTTTNGTTKTVVFTVIRPIYNPNAIESLVHDKFGYALVDKLSTRFIRTNRWGYEDGFGISESGSSGIFTIANGTSWFGGERIQTNTISSSQPLCRLFLTNTGSSTGWSSSLVTASIVSGYDANTGTGKITGFGGGAGHYTVNYIFKSLADGDNDMYIALGQSDYTTLALAAASNPPGNLPAMIDQTKGLGLLVGRIINQKQVRPAAEIDSAFNTNFGIQAASTHNNLAGLQGGTANEYYHLTATEYGAATNGVFLRASSSYLLLTGSAGQYPLKVQSDINDFSEVYVQNINAGPQASSDAAVTANNGSPNTYFIDMGINSSGYTASYVGNANDAYLFSTGSNSNKLFIGCTDPSGATYIFGSGFANTGSGLIVNGGSVTSNLPFTSSIMFGTASKATLADTASYVQAANIAGVLSATQAPLAVSASWVSASNFITTAQTASYVQATNIAGTLTATQAPNAVSASWASSSVSASWAPPVATDNTIYATSASWASSSVSASYAPPQTVDNTTYATSASWASSSVSSSYTVGALSSTGGKITGQLEISSSSTTLTALTINTLVNNAPSLVITNNNTAYDTVIDVYNSTDRGTFMQQSSLVGGNTVFGHAGGSGNIIIDNTTTNLVPAITFSFNSAPAAYVNASGFKGSGANLTGITSATNATYATSASWATASYTALNSTYATSASWATASYTALNSTYATSASYVSASIKITTADTASYVAAANVAGTLTATQAPLAVSASWVSASNTITTAQTASYVAASNVSGVLTATQAPNAISSSWASASYTALNSTYATSASWATASYTALNSTYATSASWATASKILFPTVSTVAQAVTQALDMSTVMFYSSSISASTYLTCSSPASGRMTSIRLYATASAGSAVSLTYPSSWIWLGNVPLGITSSKTGVISLMAYGPLDADIVGTFGVSI